MGHVLPNESLVAECDVLAGDVGLHAVAGDH